MRKPHPSLWIGGERRKGHLKLVAQYGNASNFGNGDPEIIRQKCDVLKRHCDALGRDYNEIIKSTEINCVLLARESDREQTTASIRELVGMSEEEFRDNYWVGTSEEIVELLGPAINAGIDNVMLYMPRIAYDHRPLQQFASEIIPQFA